MPNNFFYLQKISLMKRDVYYLVGPKLRRLIRRVYYLPVDLLDSITGKRDALTPPKGRVFIGSGDFIKQGNNILQQFIELGGLKKNARVLDVGCGIGRLAVPLTRYLDEDGSYEGFDVVKSGIDWCNKRISKQFSNFKFTHIDLKNDLYNLETEVQAKDFIFPYRENEFDFVFLTSVFTHMMPDDVEAYLKQIHRVLQKGGTCFATFFIMNEENKQLMQATDGIKFNYSFGNYYQHNVHVKEANIAFEETYLDKLFSETGFTVENKCFGYWPGREKEKSTDFQDIVILKKK